MNLLSLFALTVYAAETVVSPLPDEAVPLTFEEIKPQVSFGQLTEVSSPQATASEVTTITPTPTPERRARQSHFTIAVLGDSMVDTLGPDVPDLTRELSKFYPGVNFAVLNYGVGATNIEYGLTRLTNGYTYLNREIKSLVSQNPDVVVVESFGYNPIPNELSLDRHWLALAKIVETLKSQLPGTKIVIAATIAPDAKTFGDGAPGVAFDVTGKTAATTIIKAYLENAVRFARGEHLPLADAYHASLDGSGNGSETYINQGDHIHPSAAGRALFGRIVTDAIVSNRLLE